MDIMSVMIRHSILVMFNQLLVTFYFEYIKNSVNTISIISEPDELYCQMFV